MRNSEENLKYSPVSRYLHWLTGLLLAVMFGTAFLFDSVDLQNKVLLLKIHASTGCLVFVLILVRLGSFFVTKNPPLLDSMAKLQKKAAKVIHFALYALVALTAAFGFVLIQAKGKDLEFILWPHPKLVEKSADLVEQTADLHENLAWVLLGFIGLHVAGVLIHRYRKDKNILKRMWF